MWMNKNIIKYILSNDQSRGGPYPSKYPAPILQELPVINVPLSGLLVALAKSETWYMSLGSMYTLYGMTSQTKFNTPQTIIQSGKVKGVKQLHAIQAVVAIIQLRARTALWATLKAPARNHNQYRFGRTTPMRPLPRAKTAKSPIARLLWLNAVWIMAWGRGSMMEIIEARPSTVHIKATARILRVCHKVPLYKRRFTRSTPCHH